MEVGAYQIALDRTLCVTILPGWKEVGPGMAVAPSSLATECQKLCSGGHPVLDYARAVRNMKRGAENAFE